MRAPIIAIVVCVACGKPGPGERVGTWGPSYDSTFGAVADGNDLFTAETTGIVRVPLDGGSAQTLVPGSFSPSVALTPDEVIFGDSKAGTVLAVPRQGGAVRTVATGQGPLSRIQFEGANVYWNTSDSAPAGPSVQSLRMVPLNGGNVVTLLSGSAASYLRVGADAGRLYFVQISIADRPGLSPVPNLVGALAADGTVTTIGYGRATMPCCLAKVNDDLIWAVDGFPGEYRKTNLVSGRSSHIRDLEPARWLGTDWMAADEHGGFYSTSGCEKSNEDDIHCWTSVRDLTTGTEVAYADVTGNGIAIDDRYLYWSADGLYRVRR